MVSNIDSSTNSKDTHPMKDGVYNELGSLVDQPIVSNNEKCHHDIVFDIFQKTMSNTIFKTQGIDSTLKKTLSHNIITDMRNKYQDWTPCSYVLSKKNHLSQSIPKNNPFLTLTHHLSTIQGTTCNQTRLSLGNIHSCFYDSVFTHTHSTNVPYPKRHHDSHLVTPYLEQHHPLNINHCLKKDHYIQFLPSLFIVNEETDSMNTESLDTSIYNVSSCTCSRYSYPVGLLSHHSQCLLCFMFHRNNSLLTKHQIKSQPCLLNDPQFIYNKRLQFKPSCVINTIDSTYPCVHFDDVLKKKSCLTINNIGFDQNILAKHHSVSCKFQHMKSYAPRDQENHCKYTYWVKRYQPFYIHIVSLLHRGFCSSVWLCNGSMCCMETDVSNNQYYRRLRSCSSPGERSNRYTTVSTGPIWYRHLTDSKRLSDQYIDQYPLHHTLHSNGLQDTFYQDKSTVYLNGLSMNTPFITPHKKKDMINTQDTKHCTQLKNLTYVDQTHDSIDSKHNGHQDLQLEKNDSLQNLTTTDSIFCPCLFYSNKIKKQINEHHLSQLTVINSVKTQSFIHHHNTLHFNINFNLQQSKSWPSSIYQDPMTVSAPLQSMSKLHSTTPIMDLVQSKNIHDSSLELNNGFCPKFNRLFVMKVVHKTKCTEEELERVGQEADILSRLIHPHIITLLSVIESKTEQWMFFEHAALGDLYTATSFKTLTETDCRYIVYQLLLALKYIHETHRLIHCDVKPHNILLFMNSTTYSQNSLNDNVNKDNISSTIISDRSLTSIHPWRLSCPNINQEIKDNSAIKLMNTHACLGCISWENIQIKLGDFGLAQTIAIGEAYVEFDGLKGTHGYFAPEVLMKHSFDYKIDLWAVGIIAFTLIGGYEPFYPVASCMEGTLEFDPRYWSNISLHGKEFLQGLLQKNPQKRFSASDALQHEWFSLLD